jgi:hypothetical protein
LSRDSTIHMQMAAYSDTATVLQSQGRNGPEGPEVCVKWSAGRDFGSLSVQRAYAAA